MTPQETGPARWVTTVATGDGSMSLYVARPDAPTGRAVVVLQEAFGVNDYVRGIADRFASRGFFAVAPDLFHRTRTGTLAYEQHADAMPLIGALGPDEIGTDVAAVLDHLADDGIARSRIAVVGFCFGGRAAFTAATQMTGLAAVVVFYGPGVAAGPHAVLDRAGRIDAPMLLHVGDRDPTIPPEHVESIDAALRATGVAFVQHVYPGAGHAFACDARPSLYRDEAARSAWGRTDAFLDEQLPPIE